MSFFCANLRLQGINENTWKYKYFEMNSLFEKRQYFLRLRYQFSLKNRKAFVYDMKKETNYQYIKTFRCTVYFYLFTYKNKLQWMFLNQFNRKRHLMQPSTLTKPLYHLPFSSRSQWICFVQERKQYHYQ